ncbi:MAG: sulfoxide reductase heme-binding subunit YedZ [Alphaproteobacteria bacterium]|nr:sulfoxide reductase heme-binding subunit YedZ [Alphaproteobacteria bacterium]
MAGPRRPDWAKRGLFVLCLVPLAWLAFDVANDALGANPIEAVNRRLGDWAIRLLLISLAVTPLRQAFHWPQAARMRRMLGLFAFFYVALHVTSYLVLDQFFDWAEIWADVVKRKYMTFGMLAFTLLLPLAITSTDAMVKRLGGARWRRLHRLVHLAAVLAVLHHFFLVKVDTTEPLLYGLILAVLLGWRVAKIKATSKSVA